MRKIIAVFLVFFLGTGGLIIVDDICRQSTGHGGQLSVEIRKMESGQIALSFMGKETTLNI